MSSERKANKATDKAIAGGGLVTRLKVHTNTNTYQRIYIQIK